MRGITLECPLCGVSATVYSESDKVSCGFCDCPMGTPGEIEQLKSEGVLKIGKHWADDIFTKEHFDLR